MRHLSWVFTVPITLVVILFAISNGEIVELTLWPLPGALGVPVYLIGLGALTIGFVAGGAVAWWTGGRHRRAARRNRNKLVAVETELATVRARLSEADEAKDREREAARVAAATDASESAARREAAEAKRLATLDAS